MADYDYGNARLRTMKSRLLTRRELVSLSAAGSLSGLIATLTKTAYQRSVESALTRSTGLECIEEALHSDLISTIGKIGSFYQEDARKTVTLALRTYDIENLKTILRGLSKNVPSGEIIAVLLPVGELKIGTLRELAGLGNPREAIDSMASQSLRYAAPLLKLRAEHPGADVFDMELALDKWHFQDAQLTLRSEADENSLSYVLALDADLTNVLTILRFVHDPAEHEVLHTKLATEEAELLFIRAGRVPPDRLSFAIRQDGMVQAIESFAGTPYESALRTGLELYGHSHLLSDIEKPLKRYRLEQHAWQIQRDPLGIGVAIGYMALKTNEIGNLRWIAQGINLEYKAEAIQAELDMIT